jgi:hypothetical protein
MISGGSYLPYCPNRGIKCIVRKLIEGIKSDLGGRYATRFNRPDHGANPFDGDRFAA